MKHPILYGVYLVKFPFLESSEFKIRPVIVVSSVVGVYGATAIVPVTSRSDKQSVDSVITSWSESGLLKPSIARVHRISTIVQSGLDGYLGKLSPLDEKALKISLKKYLYLS